MAFIWDYCKTCGRMLPVKSEEEKKERCKMCGQMLPLQLQDCKPCRAKSVVALSLTVFAIVLVVVWGFYKCTKHWFGVGGLIFDIIGAYLLATGYLESMVAAASGFGGGGDIIRGLKKKHSFRIWLGLILLILGFLGQAIQTINSPWG